MRFGSSSMIWLATVMGGCVMANPDFDAPIETDGRVDTSSSVADESDTATDATELPSDTGEESPPLCELNHGVDMTIKVPQPCGETNDVLDTYERYFNVVSGAGSTWTVQFCAPGCSECEPVTVALEFSPLDVTTLAGPGACLLMAGRRLGEGDDCNYHAVTVQDMNAGGEVVLVARRTELLELPELATFTGLAEFAPELIVNDACACSESDVCCDGQGPTLYSYLVGDVEIPVGGNAAVTLGQREFVFWAFDAYFSGECETGTNVVWALTAK